MCKLRPRPTDRLASPIWPPREHAARILVSGLPTGLDCCLREVEVTHVALTVDRPRIYLQEMHDSGAVISGECLGLGGVAAFLGQHFVQFAHHMAHPMKLSVPCDVAAGAAPEQNILLAHEHLRNGVRFWAPRVPDLNRKDDGTAPRVVVEHDLNGRI